MDINLLKKIVKIVEDSSITELEIEEENTRIKVSKNTGAVHYAATQHPAPPFPVPVASQHAHLRPADEAAAAIAKAKDDLPGNLHEVKSPIVGTFYRAPAPDADSYAKVGDEISVGQVLCIVEAMKLMNEIESDVSGKIVKILVENGKPVEYNQPLFLIEI
ncbi:MAG: acetyl-CoA carboxylase biotin carboxyl carrier protein [Ignavibacteriaceae bacterium]|nr:acetyl-CoA carboxylase biotin carboxyl carrier protein [Ignavibacteriaceae bacterium]